MAAEDTDMSDLVVIGFDDEFKADEVRVELLKLQANICSISKTPPSR